MTTEKAKVVREEIERVCKDLNSACAILEKDKGKRKYGPRQRKKKLK